MMSEKASPGTSSAATALSPLPVDEVSARVVATLETRDVVLVAPPGSGKTTRIPRALLFSPAFTAGEIVVLEPRRLAARLPATRVAEELGEPVGERVGYTVRYRDASSKKTRVRFVTEGIFNTMIHRDPHLARVSAVVLDEFHERHLHGDFALAWLRYLRKLGRRIPLLVMSATIDGASLAAELDAELIESDGKLFPVDVHYESDDRPLALQVVSAFRHAAKLRETTTTTSCSGSTILAFLPGSKEIREAREACTQLAGSLGYDLAVLHGELSPDEQDAAIRAERKPKLILSTNVAESSVTIPGVFAVIDSGLARVALVDPYTGLTTLRVERISRASADQRAGRAGRLGPGHAIRIYSRGDYERMSNAPIPEVLTADLAGLALDLAAMKENPAKGLLGLPWLTAPPERASRSANELLLILGAAAANTSHSNVHITPFGADLHALPLHPRLAAIACRAADFGYSAIGCLAAAILAERDFRLAARSLGQGGGHGGSERRGSGRGHGATEASDVYLLCSLYWEAERSNFRASAVAASGLDHAGVQRVRAAYEQLSRLMDRLLERSSTAAPTRSSGVDRVSEEEALLRALLYAFPDRVARRKAPESKDFALAEKGNARLADESLVRDAEFIVGVNVDDYQGRARIRLASRIEPDWLIDVAPDLLVESDEVLWDGPKERVRVVSRMSYLGLPISESAKARGDSIEATALLVKMAKARGVHSLLKDGKGSEERYERLLSRLAFANRGATSASSSKAVIAKEPSEPKTESTDAPANPGEIAIQTWIDQVLSSAAEVCSSLEELRAQLSYEAFASSVPKELGLATVPDLLDLPSGREVRIHFAGDEPFVESYLQDFFGWSSIPIVGGKPLTIHLLAPNKRPVQITRDLPSFWKTHYPAIRKELMRKYPRHDWPEDPGKALPMRHRGKF
jgi:ATP-dependent helicase HrpB